ncbi:MAG TPA: hypothetical protein DHV48_03610 [Prolixibacteraceae bacterium]|nr:hypothetical protein [Prolixibacteraceae bacterium]
MSGEKGFVSDQMRSGRIVSHGQITDLTNGFKPTNEVTFSIIVIPKANITAGVISAPTDLGIMVSMAMYQDDGFSDYPVYFNTETIALIKEIEADAIPLETYDVYWASGSKVETT